MSILMAFKKGDTVYMGTDTRVIINDHKKSEICESNYKIQKLENGMLVGITADRLTRQTIFANSEIFTLDKKGELTRKHIVKEIIPKLFELLDKEDLLVANDERLYMEASILLAYKSELYEIGCYFAVYKYEDFQILGSVSGYGQFILETTKDADDVNKRIIKALDIIAKNSQLVGKPYLLIDTKELEYKLV